MFEGARGVKICIGGIDTGQCVTFLLYFIKILIVNEKTAVCEKMEKRCHQAVMDAQ